MISSSSIMHSNMCLVSNVPIFSLGLPTPIYGVTRELFRIVIATKWVSSLPSFLTKNFPNHQLPPSENGSNQTQLLITENLKIHDLNLRNKPEIISLITSLLKKTHPIIYRHDRPCRQIPSQHSLFFFR